MLLATSPTALRLAGTVIPWVSRQAADSIRGRLAATAEWLAWSPPTVGPLIWVHAASVGEALTSLPVVHRLRVMHPGISSMLTFTSPSVTGWPGDLGTDRAGYLPPDDRATTDALFRHLAPAALVFARGDVWPGLVAAAHRHRTPVMLVGGAVLPASSRLRLVTRGALRSTYQAVCWAGAVSAADAERLHRLGVGQGAMAITGDPRHDQILERPVSLGPWREIRAWAGSDPVMVAGSTHPEDECALLEAFHRIQVSHPRARLVVVPHRPKGQQDPGLPDAADASRLAPGLLPTGASADHRMLMGTGMGRLADLYLAATVAYVGGGLKTAGLHAVAEPAAFGIPVLFGQGDPRRTPADAAALLAAGGGAVISPRDAAAAIADRWRHWLDDPHAAGRAGAAARATVHSGAADVSARAILERCERT